MWRLVTAKLSYVTCRQRWKCGGSRTVRSARCRPGSSVFFRLSSFFFLYVFSGCLTLVYVLHGDFCFRILGVTFQRREVTSDGTAARRRLTWAAAGWQMLEKAGTSVNNEVKEVNFILSKKCCKDLHSAPVITVIFYKQKIWNISLTDKLINVFDVTLTTLTLFMQLQSKWTQWSKPASIDLHFNTKHSCTSVQRLKINWI